MNHTKIVVLFLLVALSKGFQFSEDQDVVDEQDGTSDRIYELETIVYRQQAQIEEQKNALSRLQGHVDAFFHGQAKELSIVTEDVEIMTENMTEMSERFERKMREMDQTIDRIRTTANEDTEMPNSWKEDITELKNRMTNVEERADNAVSVTSTLQAHVVGFKNLLRNYTEESKAVRGELKKTQDSLKTHTEESEIIGEEIKETQHALKNHTEEIETLREMLQETQKASTNHADGIETLRKKFKEAQEEFKRHTEESETVQREFTEAKETLRSNAEEVEILRKEFTDIQNAFKNHTEESETLMEEFTEAQEELKHQDEEMKRSLDNVLYDQNERLSIIENRLNVSEATLFDQIKILNDFMKNAMSSLTEREEEINAINNRISAEEQLSLNVSKNFRFDIEGIQEDLRFLQGRMVKIDESLRKTEDGVSESDLARFEERVRQVQNLFNEFTLKVAEKVSAVTDEIGKIRQETSLEVLEEVIERKAGDQIESNRNETDNVIARVKDTIEIVSARIDVQSQILSAIGFQVNQSKEAFVSCQAQILNMSSLMEEHSRNLLDEEELQRRVMATEIAVAAIPELEEMMRQQNSTLNQFQSTINNLSNPSSTAAPHYNGFHFDTFNNDPTSHIRNTLRRNQGRDQNNSQGRNPFVYSSQRGLRPPRNRLH